MSQLHSLLERALHETDPEAARAALTSLRELPNRGAVVEPLLKYLEDFIAGRSADELPLAPRKSWLDSLNPKPKLAPRPADWGRFDDRSLIQRTVEALPESDARCRETLSRLLRAKINRTSTEEAIALALARQISVREMVGLLDECRRLKVKDPERLARLGRVLLMADETYAWPLLEFLTVRQSNRGL